MPKFYVQTGTLTKIVIAEDAQGAALATVHNVLGDAINTEQRISTPLQIVDQDEVADICDRFEDQVHVSEIGFGRSEAGLFNLEEIIQSWHQLMVAIENMINRIA